MNIQQEVSEIKKIYSAERMKPVLARLKAVWSFESADRAPFVFSDLSLPEDKNRGFHDFRGFSSKEAKLEIELKRLKARGFLNDDYVPSLQPGLYNANNLIPHAYGCRVKHDQDEHQWIYPLIREPREVHGLKKPSNLLEKSHLCRETIECIKYFRKETKGELPIQICDNQGPLDLASLIWHYEDFIVAMVENPKEVHALLDMVTDSIIEWIYLMLDAAEGDLIPTHVMPWLWMPQDKGVAISEDIMAVLSSAVYEEFAIPYNERIASEFGAIFVHSCGGPFFSNGHVVASLLKTKGLIGCHLGSPNWATEIARRMGKNYLFMPDFWEGTSDEVKKWMQMVRNGYFGVLSINVRGKNLSSEEMISLNQFALKETKIVC